MSFNTWNGFHSRALTKEHTTFAFHRERLKAAQNTIAVVCPDILVLTEACFSRSAPSGARPMDYRSLFGFPFSYDAPYGSGRGLSILSRYPIVSAHNYTVSPNVFVRAEIDVDGSVVHLNAAHPHPSISEEDKRNFFSSILRDSVRPCVLLGDFNTLSDEDVYDRQVLEKGFSRFDSHAQKTVNDLMKRLTVPEIRRHGMLDTLRTITNSPEITIPTDLLSSEKDSGIRIDYIFCSNDFEVKDAAVVKNAFTEKASDHYPVLAVLHLQ